MNNFLLISRNIIRQLFREKGSVLIFIILPMASIFLSLALFSNSNNYNIRVGVVDKDKGNISAALTEDIKKQENFVVSTPDESQINSTLTAGKLDCVLVIPEGFSEGLITGNIKKINVVSIQGISATAWVDSYLGMFVSNMHLLSAGSKGDRDVFNKYYLNYTTNSTSTELIRLKNTITGMNITYFGIGFLIQFLLIGAGRTASLIIRERQQKTLMRIRCAPIKGYQFMAGNVFVNIVMITLQTVIALMLLKYILKVSMGTSILNLMIVLFPLLIAGIGLTMMLAAFAKTERHLGTMLTMVIYPTCLISGCFWDASMMPDFMQKIAKFTPQRWALDGIESLMMGDSLGSISQNILVLFAFAAAFFAVAVYGFTKNKSVGAMG